MLRAFMFVCLAVPFAACDAGATDETRSVVMRETDGQQVVVACDREPEACEAPAGLATESYNAGCSASQAISCALSTPGGWTYQGCTYNYATFTYVNGHWVRSDTYTCSYSSTPNPTN